MDLRVIGVRQWLDERIPISLVLIDEDSETIYKRLVVPLCLAVGLRMVGQRLVVFESEHCPDVRKDFPHCLLYTSPSPRDLSTSRMPSSA